MVVRLPIHSFIYSFGHATIHYFLHFLIFHTYIFAIYFVHNAIQTLDFFVSIYIFIHMVYFVHLLVYICMYIYTYMNLYEHRKIRAPLFHSTLLLFFVSLVYRGIVCKLRCFSLCVHMCKIDANPCWQHLLAIDICGDSFPLYSL